MAICVHFSGSRNQLWNIFSAETMKPFLSVSKNRLACGYYILFRCPASISLSKSKIIQLGIKGFLKTFSRCHACHCSVCLGRRVVFLPSYKSMAGAGLTLTPRENWGHSVSWPINTGLFLGRKDAFYAFMLNTQVAAKWIQGSKMRYLISELFIYSSMSFN